MRIIDRFNFSYDTGFITMPKGSLILKVEKPKTFVLWALVNPDAILIDRAIRLYSTGQELDEEYIGVYIDTVHDGPYVWHIFDRGEIVNFNKIEKLDKKL